VTFLLPRYDNRLFEAWYSHEQSRSFPDDSLKIANVCAPAWMPTLNTNLAANFLNREQLLHEAVLLTFCDPLPQQCARLSNLSERQWWKLQKWLDISGLALYFLDRMVEVQLFDMVPTSVLGRLQQKLHDNIGRTDGMAAESVAIQQELQGADLSYAALKGFSLCPDSVPKPELRHQFDLDFLVAEESAPEARQILERRGYRLYAISGRSWEFKINERPVVSLNDLYKNSPGRAVELHIEAKVPGCPGLLDRVESRDFHGMRMPVLSPVDLFLGQGLHVYKHVFSEFSRAAHLLEFRRHVLLRGNDDRFWDELRSVAEGNPRAVLGLGVVTQLITRVMGDFAPEALTNWTANRLPPSARLWINMYGRRVVFDKFPGSKLYLLLQNELESTGIPSKRSLRESLLPRRLPPAIIRASSRETLAARISRYRLQLNFVLGRLRFHIVEGARYSWESYRWRQIMNRPTS
jgi:hypothetical protein